MKADGVTPEILAQEEAAIALFDADDKRAIAAFKQLLKKSPRNLTAHFQLALYYIRTEQLDLAMEHAQMVRRMNPREENIHLNIGVIYKKMGDVKNAIRCYKRELALYPNCAEAHGNLGNIYLKRRRWELAFLHFQTARKINSRGDGVHLNLGAYFEEIGNTKRAIRLYKRELELYPNCTEALFNLGIIYYQRRRWKTAIKYLQHCFDLRFCIDEFVLKLADCYDNTDQVAKEIALYHAYLNIFPDDGEVLQNLGAALLDADAYEHSLFYSRCAKAFECDAAMVDRNIQRALFYAVGRDKEARAIPRE